MKILMTIAETQRYLNDLRNANKSIGFVPTMGALHQGHLELLSRSKNENDISVCSIFVNPIQFNNPEDLKKYPRTFEADCSKLESVNCDVLFAPDATEMYPEKNQKEYDFGLLEKVMEGKFRPGHFNGVAVVVKLLFDITEPHRAYFGEKDFQQLAVINAMVKQEKLKVNIVPCATVREEDGLAMSSRNVRLTAEEREIAPIIYKTLTSIKERKYTFSIKELCDWAKSELNNTARMEIEYFEIVDSENLQPIHSFKDCPHSVACVASFLGSVRLIDNIRLT